MPPATRRPGPAVAACLSAVLLLSACGGGGGGTGGGSGDWYYHWSCNGDSECLSTNPTGQASGTSGPISGGQIGCNELMTFGNKFWNIPPAAQSCDQSASGSGTPRTLRSIAVSPPTASVPKGGSTSFTATGTYTDGSTGDVTGSATWSSSNGTVAHLMGAQAVGDAPGTTTITARIDAISGSATLTVTPATLSSIAVTPTSPKLPVGARLPLTATGQYSDGSTQDLTRSVTWGSTGPGIATVAAGGLLTAVAVGRTTATATMGALTGSADVSVQTLRSVKVGPVNPILPVGQTLQFTATAIFSDGTAGDVTAFVTWASSATGVASIGGGGLATAVAVGSSTISATMGSVSDGTSLAVAPAQMTWTVRASGAGVKPLVAVAASGSEYVAVGSNVIDTSSDGVSWTSQPAGASYALSGVAWGGGRFVAIGKDGGGNPVALRSTDGVTWTATILSPTMQLNGITWSGSQFVAGGYLYSSANPTQTLGLVIVTSPDGITWTRHDVTGGSPSGLGASPTTAVAVGDQGSILTSSDLSTWTPRASGTQSPLFGVAWSGSRFIAVGGVATILTSPDGIGWTTANAGTFTWFRGIACAPAECVAVGMSGVVVYSADGLTWESASSGTTTDLNAVATQGGQFVAVGGGTNGVILSSP